MNALAVILCTAFVGAYFLFALAVFGVLNPW